MPLPWGDPLAREPFDRYKETERQRTGNFISSIVSRAQTRSLERISGVQPMLRTLPKKKKNFLDRTISAIDKATPEFSEDIGKGALKAISAPQEYVGKPLFAISTGQLGARQQAGENGQTYRRFDPSWSDWGRGIKKLATQDPRDTYNEARQAYDEGMRDPNKSRWKAAATEALSDPLTYIPIGGVTKLGAKAPLALKAGKVGKVGRGAAALLETAPRTAAYGVAGSSIGAELAPRVGLPEWVGTVGGGIGGGILSVKAPRTPRMDLNANVVADAVPPPASQVDNFGLDALGKPLPRKAAKAMTMEPTREDLMKWLLEDPDTTVKDAAFLVNSAEIDATRDAYFRDALKRNKALREVGDLKTPYRENIERVGLDAENIARGKKALLARVSSEASKKEITPDMAESARWFIKELPDKYLDRLGSSYVKRGEGALAGQYIAKDADVEDGIIRIIKGVANNSPEADRVIIHEIGHHLEQFVEDADYLALRKQWAREMGDPGVLPGSGRGGQTLVDDVDQLHTGLAKELDKNPTFRYDSNPEVITPENYRYQGGFGEWFAENIADRGTRDFRALGLDEATAAPWKRAWETVKDFADTVYRFLLRRGEKDAAERVYQKIMKGEYTESTRGLREQASLSGNLPQFDTPSSTALTPASTGVSQPAAAPPNAGGGASAGTGGPGGAPPPPPGPLPSQPGKKPARDMLNTIERGDRLAEELKHHQTLRGKIETVARKGAAKVGGTKGDRNLIQDDLVTPFIVKERNRLDNLVGSYEGEADDLFAQMETALKGAFTVEPDGSRKMLNGATFSDMFERKTPQGIAAYNSLSNPQVAAIERMRDFGDELNANLRYHNKTGTLGWDNSLDDYFPRVAVGKDGTPFARFGDSRAIGSKKPFMKDRTFDTFEEGLKNKINYADERQAWRMATRAKLRVASDDYIAKNILPLGLKKKQIPPGLNIGTDYVQIPRDVAPALQGRYFEKDVAERIIATLQPNPVVDLKFITGINRALTPLRATGDISWLFQQGLPMVYRHPIKAAKGALGVINSATFGDRKAYDRLMESVNWNKREAIEHGLYWTGQDLPSADHGLVKVGARFTEKPVIGTVVKGYNKMADFSNETFGRYMNYVRATFAGDAQERLAKMKPNMDPLEYRREYQKAMSAVNRLSGNTGRKVTSLESTFAFAPRYFSASVEQLAAAVSKGGLEGSIARRHMFNMLMTGGAFVAAVNASRGFETSFDPKDEDFLKLKFDPNKMKETEWNILDPKVASNFLRARDIGGLDVSPFGTYDTLFRAIAMTAVGDDEGGGPDLTKLWKLAEGKMSPGLKLVYEPLIRKSTYSGEPLDPTSIKGWADIAGKQAVAAAPFSVQNLIDEGITPSVEERSVKPLLQSLPGLAASAAGATNNPVTPTEYRNWRRDEVALEKYGVKYNDLETGAQKSIVNEDPQVQKYQEEADKNTLTRGDDLSINQAAAIENRAAIEALTESFDSGEIRGSEFRQRYRDLQNRLRGARSVLKQREGDKEIEGYFKLFDDATRADKSLDYEMLEPLLAEYEAAHPDVLAKVEAITGTQDNAVMREFRVARKEAQEYYELPAYAGLTAAEGEVVRPILDITRTLVSNNRARDYRHALAMLMEMDYITEADARLAIMATKGGSSPERKQYRLTHPTFAKFYLDDIETLAGNELPSLNAFPDAPKRARRTASRVGLREVKRTVRRSA